MELDAIITPQDHTGLQIAEVSVEEILNCKTENIRCRAYDIAMTGTRYQVLKRSRVCACCGIIGNRMFLDFDKAQSEETGKDCCHFNLYAESYDTLHNNRHLCLMVKNCIVPRSKGGDDLDLSNLQTMCYNCANLKELTDDLPLEKLRTIMFPAYRAYRSTNVLNKAKEFTLAFRDKIGKNENAIPKIQEAMKVVKVEKLPELEKKIETLNKQTAELKEMVYKFELEAQTTGVVPESLE